MNRRSIEIRKWLLEMGLKQKDIAAKAGVIRNSVCNFIHGRKSSRTIARALVELGCPKELLEKAA